MNGRRNSLILIFLLGLAGCGGNGSGKLSITGAVTDKGQPLRVDEKTQVTITFAPAEMTGRTYPAHFDRANATYKVEVPPGRYRVRVLVFDRATNTPRKVPQSDATFDLQASKEMNLELFP